MPNLSGVGCDFPKNVIRGLLRLRGGVDQKLAIIAKLLQ
jgi:hypothetical protein